MLTFHAPAAADKEWIDPILAMEPVRACEYNFTTIYLWGGPFHKRIARCGDRLVMRLFQGSEVCYLYPVGSGPLLPVLDEMSADARRHGAPLRMICVPQTLRDRLEQAAPGRFTFEADRKAFDYIYSVDKLADLAGKKLHGKRNHIHRFDENYPDWMFEPLTDSNIPECLAMDAAWFARRDQEVDADARSELGYENDAVRDALEHFDALGLEGGLIRADGQVVAFALGDRLGADCYDVHFEKAFGDIQGAYTVINREFARYIRANHPEVRWINREDDVDQEGLRKAKLSYYPDILLEKFTAAEV